MGTTIRMCRSYGKSELAMLFYPGHSASSARRRFNVELRANRTLWTMLHRQGYNPRAHSFTARQVATIVHFLGEPLEDEMYDG